MRRTEANEQMLNKYDPWKIGERMLQQMERQGMSLKAFSHLLQSCSAPPCGNLPRYVSAAEMLREKGSRPPQMISKASTAR